MGLVPEKTCRESVRGKDSPSEPHLFVVLFVLFSFELELLGRVVGVGVGWEGTWNTVIFSMPVHGF